jgi:hypothetical protein
MDAACDRTVVASEMECRRSEPGEKPKNRADYAKAGSHKNEDHEPCDYRC